MHHHTLKTQKTAHIYTHNTFSEKTLSVWIVLHGYGQLTKYFIRKFNILPEEHFVVAPEALSRFYVQGYSGRVGANWMTKEDRLIDIEDYIRYLNHVYETFIFPHLNENIKVNVVGFSQGGATASRWVNNTGFKVDNLILWSCVFPPDMNFETIQNKNLDCYLLYGNEDEFNVQQQVEEIKPVIESGKVNCKIIPFEGTHNIPSKVLLDLISQYNL